jgi:DNA polymerase III alpha subunit
VKTELNTRTLWFDGTNQVIPDDVPSLILSGCSLDQIVVTALNDDVNQFNLIEDEMISTEKNENKPFNFDYNIPEEYRNLDVLKYLLEKMQPPKKEYADRLINEWKEIQKREMEPLIKTLIYIVDKFKESKTVWGVGRGSSCASLALFLIGLHKVDPIKFGIPMTEFFHD